MNSTSLIQDLAVVLIAAGLTGWFCRRVGLSSVFGFLVAGILVGPHTPPFAYVTDQGQIHALSQLGLVFLMFSLGLRFSLRRLRELGLSLVFATLAGAVALYNLGRFIGVALGWSPVESLFLAGVIMVSSSAVISKVLQEARGVHERWGQLALGITLLEDVVAVVMLTLLNSVIQGGNALEGTSWVDVITSMGGFIILAGITGLLVVPWVLRGLLRYAGNEITSIVLCGLLFIIALAATWAGYSLALGSFMLGAIVAETPQHRVAERVFASFKDVFGALFFTAIGMLIEVRVLWDSLGLILGLSAAAVAARWIACAGGLLIAGVGFRDAFRAGVSLTPLGEFSLVMAQLGVLSGVFGAGFQAEVSGMVLLTTLAAPFLIRHGETLVGWATSVQPRWLRDGLEGYRRWLSDFMAKGQATLWWRLSRKRFIQVGVEVLFVSGVLLFAEPLRDLLVDLVPENGPWPRVTSIGFIAVVTLLVLAPLVAISRNISAMAMIYAEMVARGNRYKRVLVPVVEALLKSLAGGLLALWLWTLLPSGMVGLGGLLVIAAGAIIAVVILWRRLVFWHSRVEIDLKDTLEAPGMRGLGARRVLSGLPGDWSVRLDECVLPEFSPARGRRLDQLALRQRFGVIVAAVERQGIPIRRPAGKTHLFPGDRLLLLGEADNLTRAREYLELTADEIESDTGLAEAVLESVDVSEGCSLDGCKLKDVEIAARTGVQVVGIERNEKKSVNPGPDEYIRAGDRLLVLGRPEQIEQFQRQFVEAEEDGPASAGP